MNSVLFNDPMLSIGLMILAGYFMGGIAVRYGLPRITGYLTAGLILNPTLMGPIPPQFIAGTGTMVNVLLCVITFEIGGSLNREKISALGKTIISMTFFEAEGAFFVVFAGMWLFCEFFGSAFGISGTPTILAFSLLMGGLVSPTDPAATIAVVHQYDARGPVTSTILGVSAFDDGFGIVNFGIALSLAKIILTGQKGISPLMVIASPLWIILLSILTGCVFGWFVDKLSQKAMDQVGTGPLIIVLLGGLTACFGVAEALEADELLATMVMGAWVVNFNEGAEEIFSVVESTLEEPVFLIFFCVSGMTLDFPSLLSSLGLIPIVVLLRLAGKAMGVYAGGSLSGTPHSTCKSVVAGLIPLGGIVIGLALTLKRYPEMDPFASTIINVIIGCTVIHEFLGPLAAKWALKSVDEL